MVARSAKSAKDRLEIDLKEFQRETENLEYNFQTYLKYDKFTSFKL